MAELLASGLSPKEIGHLLDITESTVRNYLYAHIYRKLGVKGHAEFIRYWIVNVEMATVGCCTECIAKMV